jgi:hypothetical protein
MITTYNEVYHIFFSVFIISLVERNKGKFTWLITLQNFQKINIYYKSRIH